MHFFYDHPPVRPYALHTHFCFPSIILYVIHNPLWEHAHKMSTSNYAMYPKHILYIASLKHIDYWAYQKVPSLDSWAQELCNDIWHAYIALIPLSFTIVASAQMTLIITWWFMLKKHCAWMNGLPTVQVFMIFWEDNNSLW